MFLIILVSVVVWFVFYPWWIFFTCHILMHFHTLFFPSLLLFWVCVCVCVHARVRMCGCFPFFYSKIFLTMAPKVKKSIPSKILSLDMLYFLFFYSISYMVLWLKIPDGFWQEIFWPGNSCRMPGHLIWFFKYYDTRII